MLGAWAIQKWMKADYSHVYLRVYSQYTNQWLVYQASHGMVHLRLWKWFFSGNEPVVEYELELPEQDLKNTIKIAQQLLGQPYGYLGLLKIVLRRCGFKVAGDGLNSFHCSELIAVLMPELAKGMQADFIEPVDLQKHLDAIGAKKV